MFETRWYQSEAEQSIFDYFDARPGQPGNPVVAMPTGTGKSIVIGNFIKRAFGHFPNTRLMMLTHVKELITQNAEKLMRVWPTAPLGIHSAGLKQRDIMLPIIYGGVATVKNNIEAFGFRDLLLIDEAHLLSPKSETMYHAVIAALLKFNPYLKVIGFTATPYRMQQGMITDDGIFTDICYDCTTTESFNRLIAEGYLSPPIPKQTDAHIDVSNVGLQNGDFAAGQLEAAADIQAITYAAVRETIQFGYNRKSWLMFASGVNHAEHIAEMLRSFDIPAAAVHSKLSAKENDERIAAHKRGEIRALVNMGKLTTGYDHPPIDLIGMLRPTLSPGLWVQMLGRGTRPFSGYLPWGEYYNKQNCLVLDFARNTPRLGPINDPVKPRKPGEGGGDAPVRICDNCSCYNHASARFCVNCGMEFTFETKIFKTAGNQELLRGDAPIVQSFPVDRVIYAMHEKAATGNRMVKAMYFCGFHMFNEYINFESKAPYVRHKANDWWKQRSGFQAPTSNDEALARTNELRYPERLRVWTNKQYPEILGYEF